MYYYLKMKKVSVNNLQISEDLFKFVNEEAIPGTNLQSNKFWKDFDEAVHRLTPINKKLLERRDEIQKKIDEWHLSRKGNNFNKDEYFNFLKSIGYIAKDQGEFKIETINVDEEISSIAGPQLVVPVDNARYALNAANARWGSLYDAVYGTDVIPGKISKVYSKERGKKVINYVREFLDEIFSIENGSWKEISKIKIEGDELKFSIKDKNQSLKNKNHFVAFSGKKGNPSSVLLKNNKLHIDIIIDPNSPAGKNDKANISNVIVESATKWIGGHGTSIGGIVIDGGNFNWGNGKFPLFSEPNEGYHGLKFWEVFGDNNPLGLPNVAFAIKLRVDGLRSFGPCLSPANSFQLIQGIETLSLRMERTVENTLNVAKYLQEHKKVESVNYPSLNGNRYHELSQKYFSKGSGGVLTFELKGGKEAGQKFISSLKLVSHLANIGDAKTLAIHPSSTTHEQLNPEEQISAGVTPGLVRLSVGIEHLDDIIEDIAQALEQCS